MKGHVARKRFGQNFLVDRGIISASVSTIHPQRGDKRCIRDRNSQRQSGLLHPFLAPSSRTGLDLTVPYYWNIAPNYDATLYPRYMSKRGLQLGAEVRYWDFNSGVPGDPNAYKVEYICLLYTSRCV